MAYDSKQFGVLNYANGFTHWVYQTEDSLKVAAGLTPQEAAEWEYKTKVGITQAVASVKFPSSMIVAGGNGEGGSVNPFDAVGLKSLYDLSNQMSK